MILKISCSIHNKELPPLKPEGGVKLMRGVYGCKARERFVVISDSFDNEPRDRPATVASERIQSHRRR